LRSIYSRDPFLFLDLILKGHLPKPLNTQTQKNISSDIFLETTKLNSPLQLDSKTQALYQFIQ